MAYGQVPRRWNSYRPSYDGEDPYAASYNDNDRYPRSRPTRASGRVSGSLSPPDSSNPNMIPLSHAIPIHNTQGDDDINHLMGTTSRAFHLVIHYEEDSMGGTRWTAADIEQIRHAGRYLSTDTHALRDLRAKAGKKVDPLQAEDMARRVTAMRHACHRIRDLINDLEKVPENQRKWWIGRVDHSPGLAIRGAATREKAFKEHGQYQDTSQNTSVHELPSY